VFSSYSKCTKDCEGGTKARTRQITEEPYNGGKGCPALVDSVACNTGSCDRNCRLHEWTKPTLCSQACDGGFEEKFRKIRMPTRGRGVCETKMSRERYEKSSCNSHDCVGDEVCIAKLDVVIALDGSGSLVETGFEMLKNFTGELAMKFVGKRYKREMMQVGVVQFGQGEILTDDKGVSTVSPAKLVLGMTDDMPKVAAEIKKLKWEKGFTNMAQAFTASEALFEDRGRKDAQSVIIVITDGKPSFKYQTQKAVNDLRDAGVHVNFVTVHPAAESSEVKQMMAWASHPAESHMIHIPGMKALQKSAKMYATKSLVQFCPRALSPSTEIEEEKEQGFELVVEARDCLDWWVRVHKNCPNGRCAGLDDCAAAAREMGIKYFVFYPFKTRAYCYANKANDGKCNFEKRPWMRKKGWTNSVFSVYRLKGELGGGDAAATMLVNTETGKETDEELPEAKRPSEDSPEVLKQITEQEDSKIPFGNNDGIPEKVIVASDDEV